MSGAALRLEGVSARLGGREVLRAVSLTIPAGEMAAIIGPNGSGKSTLLRVIVRALRPSAGRVLLDETDVRSLSPGLVARRVAYLPQAPVAPPDLTVAELVWRGRYPYRRLLRGSGDSDRRAVSRALALAEMESLGNRALGALSGGERQRAWIALALAQEPDVLLLDEPTTFLDIGHQVELLRLLATLNRDTSLTVAMVVHDLGHAAHVARRVIGLREGEVVFDGPPAEVLTSERVSDLFGVGVRVWQDPETGDPVVLPRLEARSPRV